MPLPQPSVETNTHTMPEPKPAWCYWYSPWNLRVHVIDGKEEILPVLSVSIYDHGANGVTIREHGDPGDFTAYDTARADLIMTEKGMVPVPHTIEYQMGGKKVRGYVQDRAWRAKSRDGVKPYYFASRFETVKVIAGRVRKEYDREGFLNLHRAVAKLIGPLSPEQIEVARESTPKPPEPK